MRRIVVFTNVSLDGYFEAPGHDISWAKSDNEAFSIQGGEEVDAFLFGHRTYEMMKSFWPTPQAAEMMPEIAKVMNERLKLVASHQPFEPGWRNVNVISGEVSKGVSLLKSGPGKTIMIFGSNMLVVSLLEAGLIDELQILVNPVAIGKGTSIFAGLNSKVEMNLTATRQFKSGVMMLTYAPDYAGSGGKP